MPLQFKSAVHLLAIAILLSGCLQAAQPLPEGSIGPGPTMEWPAPSSQPTAPPPSIPPQPGYLRLEAAGGYPPVTHQNRITFSYSASVDLERAVLENALGEQIISNLPERETIEYAVEWHSDREFTINFANLLPRENIHFSVAHSTGGEDGPRLNEEMPRLFDAAFQYRDSATPGAIVLTLVEPFRHTYLPASASIQQLATRGNAKTPFALAYDEENLHMTNLSDGTAATVALPVAKTQAGLKSADDYPLERLHGYQHVILPKHFDEDYIYLVLSHSMVYRLSLTTGQSKLIHTSNLPIVGMSASPDGKLIGLMTQDNRLLSEADFTVINETGEVMATFPEASYISHSDGYLGYYSLEWADNSKARIMTHFPKKAESGFNEIDVSTKAVVEIVDPSPNLEAVREINLREQEIIPFLSPDQSRLAYITRSNDQFFQEIWLTDISGNTAQFVGIGRFLGWISADTMAWVEYGDDEEQHML